MASVIIARHIRQRKFQPDRVFRDRTNPLEVYSDEELMQKFRFPRNFILSLTEEIKEDIEVEKRKGSLPPILQVLMALQYYATGSFQSSIGDFGGVGQSTVSRLITRVTNALASHVREWIHLPTQAEADKAKEKFKEMSGFPDVFACIDCTHVRIKGPRERQQDYVNRKQYHSINVQVICDADMVFLNAIAKWPGSVEDSRILEQSPLSAALDGKAPPLKGLVLGDEAYMPRPWLMTPVEDPTTPKEQAYNSAHETARSTVDRAIQSAKQRWRCLQIGMRFQPPKVCQVILVCLMLQNRARRLGLPDSSVEDEPWDESDDVTGNVPYLGFNPTPEERARTLAGRRVRDGIIQNCF